MSPARKPPPPLRALAMVMAGCALAAASAAAAELLKDEPASLGLDVLAAALNGALAVILWGRR